MNKRQIGAACGAAVIVAGGGWVIHAATAQDAARYRLAAVTTGDVQQTLSLSGTLTRSSTSALSFTTAGTVASLKVELGSTVVKGQTIAVLDRKKLTAAVSKAKAEVASAQAKLASDKQAQVDAAQAEEEADAAAARAAATAKKQAAAAKKQAATAAAEATRAAAASAAAAATKAAALAIEQKAVTEAQSAATSALADARDALSTQHAVCATAPTAQACSEALAEVLQAQQDASTAQTTLSTALSALARSIGTGAGTSGQGQAGSGSATGSGATATSLASSGSVGSSDSRTSGSVSGAGTIDGSRSVSAADLAQDQVSIDDARTGLVQARQSLAGAVVTAPFSGSIASLSIARGDTVSAGGQFAVLIGSGHTTAAVAVSAAQAAQLRAGQTATVTPVGSATPWEAEVTRVGHVADSSSTYPVVLTLDDTDVDLPNGTTAAVQVVIATSTDVLTIPTSALSNGSVTVVQDGTATRQRVTTGTISALRAEVTDGLTAGQQVSLADLDAALPTSGSGSTGPGGGFGSSSGFSGTGPGVGGRGGR